jgi:hypothetical protein
MCRHTYFVHGMIQYTQYNCVWHTSCTVNDKNRRVIQEMEHLDWHGLYIMCTFSVHFVPRTHEHFKDATGRINSQLGILKLTNLVERLLICIEFFNPTCPLLLKSRVLHSSEEFRNFTPAICEVMNHCKQHTRKKSSHLRHSLLWMQIFYTSLDLQSFTVDVRSSPYAGSQGRRSDKVLDRQWLSRNLGRHKQMFWPVVVTNTNEIQMDESCRKNATRVINVYIILVTEERDLVGDHVVIIIIIIIFINCNWVVTRWQWLSVER